MQSAERLRGDLTESCRDAAVALTAGEEFPFQLQQFEDLFRVVVGFFLNATGATLPELKSCV